MSKNIFYDIIPPNKRSIRNVTFKNGTNGDEPAENQDIHHVQPIKVYSASPIKEIRDIDDIQQESVVPIKPISPPVITEPGRIAIPISITHDIEPVKPKLIIPIKKEEVVREKVVPKISALEDWKMQKNNSKKTSSPTRPNKKFSGFGVWSVAIVSFAILFFGISSYFAHAVVNVTVKTQTVNTTVQVTAQKDGDDKALTYTEMSLAKNYSIPVKPKGTTKQQTRASASVVISNNTTVAQKLIKDTRFENIDGFIFRLQDQVIVPAANQDGGFKQPGKITAVIIADKAGAAYNIDRGTLTLPAFKNDPRYVAIVGTIDSPATGGEITTVPILSDADKAAATKTIQDEIKTELVKDVMAQIPKGFVTFHETDEYSFDPISYTVDGNNATATIKGFIRSIIFPEDILKRQLAIKLLETSTSTAQKADGLVDDISKLAVTNYNFSDPSKALISFKGQLTVRGTINEDVLKKDLRNTSRSEAQQIFSQYSGISKAEIQFIPFWSFHMPKNTDWIKIVVQK